MAKKKAAKPETNGEHVEHKEQPAAETPSLDELRRQHYEAIREKNLQVAELEQDMNAEHERYKAAKKVFEGAQSELRSLIRRDPNQRVLFQKNGDETVEPWRAVTLDDLGIEGRIAELLTEAKLTTLGAIADWTKEYQLTDIAGIGPAKAESLQATLDLYWAQNPPVDQAEEHDAAQSDLKGEIAGELADRGLLAGA